MSDQPRRILLVDDDTDIRTVARLSLSRIGGFDVVEVGDAATAIDRLGEEDFDAVLLDVSLPDMDGPAVLAVIRSDPTVHPTAVFFFTAHVLPQERAHLESLGADGFIEKPFDPVALPREIRSRLLDMETADRMANGRWEQVVRGSIEELWETHKASLANELELVERVVETWSAQDSPDGSVRGAARDATHRLCGAFGVYGRESASETALKLHAIVNSDARDDHSRAVVVDLVKELRREIDRP